MREMTFRSVSLKDVVLAIVLAMLVMCGSVMTASAQNRELSLADVLIALRSKKADAAEKNKLITDAVKQRGVTFSLTPEIEKELDSTGAAPALIAAIRVRAIPLPAPATIAQTEAKPVEAKPVEDFEFFRSRASAKINIGDNAGATVDLEKAIAMKPNDPGVRHDHAMLLSLAGSFPDAIEEYSKAIELAPGDARNYAGRAAIFEKTNKPVEALKDYQKVITLAPADQAAAASVIRITSDLTRAATEAAAASKLANSTSEKVPDNTQTNAPVGASTPVEAQPAATTPTALENAGNLGAFCVDAVKPRYPSQAMSLRAEGEVLVRVALDESGKVVEAKATNGHPALRSAAESAVRMSKFKPVTKDGKPVKATGFMSYKFVL